MGAIGGVVKGSVVMACLDYTTLRASRPTMRSKAH